MITAQNLKQYHTRINIYIEMHVYSVDIVGLNTTCEEPLKRENLHQT